VRRLKRCGLKGKIRQGGTTLRYIEGGIYKRAFFRSLLQAQVWIVIEREFALKKIESGGVIYDQHDNNLRVYVLGRDSLIPRRKRRRGLPIDEKSPNRRGISLRLIRNFLTLAGLFGATRSVRAG
jgi:hypothetical protein